MKRLSILALPLLLVGVLPVAATERPMSGSEILSSLRGASVVGDSWSQSFDDGGSTTYKSGDRVQAGRWDVRGDQYCSVWPPSDAWACYDMTIEPASAGGDDVTFISASGGKTHGHLIPKGK